MVATNIRGSREEVTHNQTGLLVPVADPPALGVAMYLTDVFTVTANLAGLPGISVPCGSDEDGLPIGLQIIGPPLGEDRILKAARLVEQLRGPFLAAPADA